MESYQIWMLVAGVILLWLVCQRWFWLLILGLGALASAFSVLTSIIHFQIFSAIGFFILTCALYFMLQKINRGY